MSAEKLKADFCKKWHLSDKDVRVREDMPGCYTVMYDRGKLLRKLPHEVKR